MEARNTQLCRQTHKYDGQWADMEQNGPMQSWKTFSWNYQKCCSSSCTNVNRMDLFDAKGHLLIQVCLATLLATFWSIGISGIKNACYWCEFSICKKRLHEYLLWFHMTLISLHLKRTIYCQVYLLQITKKKSESKCGSELICERQFKIFEDEVAARRNITAREQL